MHFEDGIVYAEPGVDARRGCERPAPIGRRFRDRNLFFGGVQAVQPDPPGGHGDSRRGGSARVV